MRMLWTRPFLPHHPHLHLLNPIQSWVRHTLTQASVMACSARGAINIHVLNALHAPIACSLLAGYVARHSDAGAANNNCSARKCHAQQTWTENMHTLLMRCPENKFPPPPTLIHRLANIVTCNHRRCKSSVPSTTTLHSYDDMVRQVKPMTWTARICINSWVWKN